MSSTLSAIPSTAGVPAVNSKLPRVGTTIFTVMSALATEHGAVNLGQGFPDFACDAALVEAVSAAMRVGHNQYPPMAGILPLREAISAKVASLYGRRYDPVTEITVTAGATQAILTAMLALVHRGDEVIVLEPVYDSYIPAILLAGGTPVTVPMTPPGSLHPNFSVPWDRVEAAVSPRTRAIIVNSPHNPSGAVFSRADMLELERIALAHGLWVVSDEVYEHMVFDGARHESAARFPGLADRTVVISSFGKTYHVTGWKVAYAAAPAALTTEFRKVHQFNVFTVNTPMQVGLAAYMADPEPYLSLPAFYQAKRDVFLEGLKHTRFEPVPSAGTYFQLVRYRGVNGEAAQLSEEEFCKWLTRTVKVAAIPVSAFYDRPLESGLIRFCFAKQESTLSEALSRLAAV